MLALAQQGAGQRCGSGVCVAGRLDCRSGAGLEQRRHTHRRLAAGFSNRHAPPRIAAPAAHRRVALCGLQKLCQLSYGGHAGQPVWQLQLNPHQRAGGWDVKQPPHRLLACTPGEMGQSGSKKASCAAATVAVMRRQAHIELLLVRGMQPAHPAESGCLPLPAHPGTDTAGGVL